MRVINHGAGGAADCLQLDERAQPVPGAGQVLIEVAYAGINRPDVLQRMGLYTPPPDAFPLLGLEVSGRIAALGEGVDGWQVGDMVAALVHGGGYAEYCIAEAGQLLPVPAGMDLATAAALPETWFTVWSNMMHHGRLAAGERLLVHGGASGIGMTAIQLARHLGVECIVTVADDEQARFCREFGASATVNFNQEDFGVEVKRLTNGEGVDVVLDIIGAPYWQRNLDLLRRDGRLVFIGFLLGFKGECDMLPVLFKRLTITGSTLRPRTPAEKMAIRDDLLAQIWPALASGALKTHLFATFPLAQAADAHRLMESNCHIGKIVLEVAPQLART